MFIMCIKFYILQLLNRKDRENNRKCFKIVFCIFLSLLKLSRIAIYNRGIHDCHTVRECKDYMYRLYYFMDGLRNICCIFHTACKLK